MKLSSPTAGYILVILYVIAGMVSVYFIMDRHLEYSRKKTIYTETLTWQNRLLNMDEWMSSDDDLQAKRLVAKKQLRQAEDELTAAKFHGYMYLAYTLCLLLALLLMYWGSKVFMRVLTFGFLGISICCLVAGVFTPMLEVSFFKEDLHIPIKIDVLVTEMDLSHTFEGNMFFFFQNKSIIQVVGLLFQNGNAFVAIFILLFSIVTPTIKILLSVLAMFASAGRKVGLLRSIDMVGKWSMVDVFVVSIFLSVLAVNSMETGIDSDSHTLPGLYFFGAYVVLSMVAFILMKITLKKEDYWPKMPPLDEAIGNALTKKSNQE